LDLEGSKIQDPKIHHILHGGTSCHDGATYNIYYCAAAWFSYIKNKLI